MWKVSFLAMCMAWTALADNAADEADIAFDQGNRAYSRRDYEQALSQYFLSYRLVPNRNVLFNIAKCYEALNRFDQAYRYWHDLSLQARLEDDDRREVKAALGRLLPRVALISVMTDPPGAELYIDREDLGSRGRTPQTVAVPPGFHTVLVKLPGYRTASAKAFIGRGREAKHALQLERVLGKVEIVGRPVGAVVRETADGPALGKIPTVLSFPPGQRLLVVTAPEFAPSQVLVDVKPDEVFAITVALTEKPKPTGKVVVTANRDNAVVRVDGKDSGFTPVVLTLTAGEHTVEVSTWEVTPFVQSVTVQADAEVRLFAELRYAPPAVRAASKSLVSVDQAPASVTVITREELRGFGYQTVAEALQAVRGVFLSDDRIYTYVGVRGFSPPGDFNNRLLILYDGHAMNDVWNGQGYVARDFDVDLSEIDRIEIVRGPASTLYGTGAIFGVINLVPRERVGENTHLEGTVAAGGQQGVKARVAASLGGPSSSILISAGAFDARGAEITDLGERGKVEGLDGERALAASLRVKVGGLTAVGKINRRTKQIPTAPFGAEVGAPGTQYNDLRGFGELRLEHAFERVNLEARATFDYSRYDGTFALPGPSGRVLLESDSGGASWFGGELRCGILLFEGNRLTLAAEGQYQLVAQTALRSERLNNTRLVLSGTAFDEWRFASWLSLQLGVRVDHYTDQGPAVLKPKLVLSPRGALVVKPYSAGVTKVVAGQAFRAPNTYEAYGNDKYVSQKPPPEQLTPELITTFEAEHSHDLTPELRLVVGGYYNLIDNLVFTDQDPPELKLCGPPDEPHSVECYFFANKKSRVSALGGEAELRWQPGRFTLIDASYSLVRVQENPQPSGGDAPIYPTHLASLRALVPIKEGFVRLAGQLTYQSARTTVQGRSPPSGEALLLNFGLSGNYGRLNYFAGVHNILDQRYALPVKSESGLAILPQYGRTFWLEVAAEF